MRIGVFARLRVVGLLLVVDIHRLVFVVDDNYTLLIDGIPIVVVNPDVMHARADIDGILGGPLEKRIAVVFADTDCPPIVELVVNEDSDSLAAGRHK